MLRIKPINAYTSERVLDLCISGVDENRSKALSQRLKNARYQIIQDFKIFESLIATNSLQLLPKDFKAKYLDNTILEDDDLEKLYTQYLVGSGKPAREVYDKIRTLNGICPYCGINEVYEVDHFFPKSKYQQYSVCLHNLLPACHACNHIKSDKDPVSSKGSIIYPFLIDNCYFNEQWIIANYNPSDKIFEFECCPPTSWSNIQKENANFHFNYFEIARRFSSFSSSKLNSYIEFSRYFILQELIEVKDLEGLPPNDCERLMFEALKRYFQNKVQVSQQLKVCPRCKGKGIILGITCEICNGNGALMASILSSYSENEIEKDFQCSHPNPNSRDCNLCRGTENVSYEKAHAYQEP